MGPGTMSWEDQGRQEHGWFGDGTAPPKFDDDAGNDDDLFEPMESSQRIAAVAQGAIGALPLDLRAPAAARSGPVTLAVLTDVMTTWASAAGLDQAEFAERFLGRSADDPVVGDLRAAASGAVYAKSHADLGEAASHLAKAMQAVELDRWQRFLADAQERARDHVGITARIPGSYQVAQVQIAVPLAMGAAQVLSDALTILGGGALILNAKPPKNPEPITNPPQLPPPVPDGWVSSPSQKGRGIIYHPPEQDPYAPGGDSIRVMPPGSSPVPGLENGYWVKEKDGQAIDPATGGTGSAGQTQVPLPPPSDQ